MNRRCARAVIICASMASAAWAVYMCTTTCVKRYTTLRCTNLNVLSWPKCLPEKLQWSQSRGRSFREVQWWMALPNIQQEVQWWMALPNVQQEVQWWMALPNIQQEVQWWMVLPNIQQEVQWWMALPNVQQEVQWWMALPNVQQEVQWWMALPNVQQEVQWWMPCLTFSKKYSDEWPCLTFSKQSDYFGFCTLCNVDFCVSHGHFDHSFRCVHGDTPHNDYRLEESTISEIWMLGGLCLLFLLAISTVYVSLCMCWGLHIMVINKIQKKLFHL